jgi:type II secretory pathway component PulC
MRALLVLAVACAPAVQPAPVKYDEDFAAKKAEPTDVAPTPEPDRAVAPVGKGARTGTIDRAHLITVLDQGPAVFLHEFEVTARMDGERFVGWQLVQLLDNAGPLTAVDVAPGDVLLAINGKPISRPDQLFAVWDSLRTANEVVAELWRGPNKLELRFAIEPKI